MNKFRARYDNVMYHDVPEHVGDAIVTFETEVKAISREETVVDVAVFLQKWWRHLVRLVWKF